MSVTYPQELLPIRENEWAEVILFKVGDLSSLADSRRYAESKAAAGHNGGRSTVAVIVRLCEVEEVDVPAAYAFAAS